MSTSSISFLIFSIYFLAKFDQISSQVSSQGRSNYFLLLNKLNQKFHHFHGKMREGETNIKKKKLNGYNNIFFFALYWDGGLHAQKIWYHFLCCVCMENIKKLFSQRNLTFNTLSLLLCNSPCSVFTVFFLPLLRVCVCLRIVVRKLWNKCI